MAGSVKRKKERWSKVLVANSKQSKQAKGDGSSSFHQLIGRTLDDVQTLGKELFMYFGDLCLRVHFLMAGQSFINNQKVDNDPGGNAETATLEIVMSKDLLTFKKSSADIRPTNTCRQKYEELNDVDICSTVFNFKRAVQMVMDQQGRQLCDVLLDQSILPGVGNIIKNEALFDSGIKPSSKVEELKEEHISHLIKMTRDFTNIFYQCRKNGKPLHPYMKIYNKKKCGQCQGKVTVCRLGDDAGRVTYFCETCQTNDPKKVTRKLPTKNSLLGWVTSGSQTKTVTQSAKPDWSCDKCTLINPANQSICQACLSPHFSNQSESTIDLTDQSNERTESDAVASKTVQSLLMPVQSNGQIIQSNDSRLTPVPHIGVSPILKQPSNSKSLSVINRGSYNTRKRSLNSNSVLPLPKRVRQENNCAQENIGPSVNQNSQHQTTAVSKIPECPNHKKKCSMREVHKKGDNLGRFFFSCTLRSCKFFQWADTSFPLCPGHGKPCTIRTVMKLGPNNGRKFFTCKMPKNKQCQFFEWAQGYD